MPGFKQGFIQGLTEVSLVQKDQLGDIRVEGSKIYKYCQLVNSATVAGVAGDPVAYTTSGADLGNAKVTLKFADATLIGAGLLTATVPGTLTVVYFVWVQVRGPANFNPAAVGTIGQVNKYGAADKTFAAMAAVADVPLIINGVVAGKFCMVIAPY
jgi:hypothetical protein